MLLLLAFLLLRFCLLLLVSLLKADVPVAAEILANANIPALAGVP